MGSVEAGVFHMAIDPLSLIVAAGATKVAADLATDALREIQKPLLEHLGHKFRDRILNRTAPVLAETDKLLDGTGKTVTDVPDRMLIPILETAALNDDEDIAKKWARLLANSAVRLDEVYPAYIDILSSLSPAEAAALDQFWSGVSEFERRNPGGFKFTLSFNPTATTLDKDKQTLTAVPSPPFVFGKFRVPPQEAIMFAGNFVRLGLWADVVKPSMSAETVQKIAKETVRKELRRDDGLSGQSGVYRGVPRSMLMREYTFTFLGVGFMKACTMVNHNKTA